jgi:hypothetical protein
MIGLRAANFQPAILNMPFGNSSLVEIVYCLRKLKNPRPYCCHPDPQQRKSKAKKRSRTNKCPVLDVLGGFDLGIEITRASCPAPGPLTECVGIVLRGLKDKL